MLQRLDTANSKGAPHLCFSLIARVLLSVPLDFTWCGFSDVRSFGVLWSIREYVRNRTQCTRYVHPDFKWTLEVQNFVLDRPGPSEEVGCTRECVDHNSFQIVPDIATKCK